MNSMSISLGNPESAQFGFKMRRRKMYVEKMHMPPEDSRSTSTTTEGVGSSGAAVSLTTNSAPKRVAKKVEFDDSSLAVLNEEDLPDVADEGEISCSSSSGGGGNRVFLKNKLDF